MTNWDSTTWNAINSLIIQVRVLMIGVQTQENPLCEIRHRKQNHVSLKDPKGWTAACSLGLFPWNIMLSHGMCGDGSGQASGWWGGPELSGPDQVRGASPRTFRGMLETGSHKASYKFVWIICSWLEGALKRCYVDTDLRNTPRNKQITSRSNFDGGEMLARN